MPKILLCGKGGSGKSTLVSLLSQILIDKGIKTLVVDTDESNLGLNVMLDMPKAELGILDYLGGRKEFRDNINEDDLFLNDKFTFDKLPDNCVSWKDQLGLVRIGKIEHSSEGCACPMGVVAHKFLNNLTVEKKQWVIVDTEAGIEHFGRGVLEGVDTVLMVVEPSYESVVLGEKVKVLTEEANKKFVIVLNKISETQEKILRNQLKERDILVGGVLRQSETISNKNLMGELIDASQFSSSIDEIINIIEKA